MPVRTPLAWRNLTHDRRRLAVAVSGVAFAVILIFMELGFLYALLESTVQVLRHVNGEVVLVSPLRYSLVSTNRFDMRRLIAARQAPGVAGVAPLYIESSLSILRQNGGRGFPVRVLAVREPDFALDIPALAVHQDALRAEGAALYDVTSRGKYGFPPPGKPLDEYRGTLNGQELRLAGRFRLGIDFANDGNLLMTAANFAHFFPERAVGGDPLRMVDVGIVRLEPGQRPEQVAKDLRRVLPADVEPFTREQLIEREMRFWRTNAPLGYIFMVGAVMGFVVGIVICYQIVYADIADHLREFATLKAMGYSPTFFIGLVLEQTVYLAVLGFLPGAAISFLSYEVLGEYTGLTMQFTASLAATVFAATAVMCILSGFLAVSKLLAADPAELF
jgi:putative ABC transport system permease protein